LLIINYLTLATALDDIGGNSYSVFVRDLFNFLALRWLFWLCGIHFI